MDMHEGHGSRSRHTLAKATQQYIPETLQYQLGLSAMAECSFIVLAHHVYQSIKKGKRAWLNPSWHRDNLANVLHYALASAIAKLRE